MVQGFCRWPQLAGSRFGSILFRGSLDLYNVKTSNKTYYDVYNLTYKRVIFIYNKLEKLSIRNVGPC